MGYYIREARLGGDQVLTDPTKLVFHTYRMPVDPAVAKVLGGVLKEQATNIDSS